MVRATSDSQDTANRRSAKRYACRPDVLCYVADLVSQTGAEARAENASTGGVCVVVEPHFTPGTRVAIDLKSPSENRVLAIFGKVVYTILLPSDREMYITGCSIQGEPLPDNKLRPYTSDSLPDGR